MLLDYNEDIKILEELGLTFSQAKVYFNAAKLGRAKAKDLWKESGVGRQELYRILDQLLEMGLIEKEICVPTQFRSLPLSRGVSLLYNRKRDEVFKLKTETQKIMRKTEKMEIIEAPESEFLILPRKYLMENRGKRSYNNAKKSIEFFCPFQRLVNAFSYNINIYGAAVERGVDMKVITEKVDADQYELLKRSVNFISRRNFSLRVAAPFDRVAFSIIDGKEIFMAVNPDKSVFEDHTLWSNNKSLIALAHKYFDFNWNLGMELTQNFSARMVN